MIWLTIGFVLTLDSLTSLFFQTFFQHRYAAHGAFKMNKFWERCFFVLTYLAQGSSYMSPRAYAIMHRMHHAYTDTEKDPHSPNFSSNVFSMMWRTRNIYEGIYKHRIEVEDRFTINLPDWATFEKWANSSFSRILWSLFYLCIFIRFATSPWLFLLLPVILAMGAFHGAVINWFAHKFGYVNFKMKNTSPSRVNFGRRWHELDPVYACIRFLNWLHIIRIVKEVKVMQ